MVCAPSKARFWSKLPPRVYVRFVPYVDGAAVGEGLTMVSRGLDKDRIAGDVFF